MASTGKYIRLSKRVLEEMFEECNALYFNNEVEKPKLFLTWTPYKKTLGLARAISDRRSGKISGALHVSRRFRWTYENLRSVVVHEMIHLLIKDYQRPLRWWERLFPFLVKEHDEEFIEIMNDLNRTYDLNIKLRFPEMRSYFKG